MSPIYPCLPAYVALCLRCQCRLLHSPPPKIVSLLILTSRYIQAMAIHMHTQGRFNNHTAHSLVTATSVTGVTKMGNIVPRAGLKPTSLAFWTSVLPLHHIGPLMSLLYPRPPVYTTPCLRGQCSLHYQ